MSIKRYSGASFADVSSRKRWNGSAWVALNVGKRWNGSAWVDLWGDSGSGSGESGSASGTLVNKVSSTVSRPVVNYSATYSASSIASALTVNLTFAAWLNSSASSLGSGVKLTVFARVRGGDWASAVIKSPASAWSGTSRHNVALSVAGTVSSDTATVEFFVTRSGSTYGGTAGTLGSASKPKSYSFKIVR